MREAPIPRSVSRLPVATKTEFVKCQYICTYIAL